MDLEADPQTSTSNLEMIISPHDAFHSMAYSGRWLLDVRSEQEFGEGSLPQSVNAPILTSSERAMVGSCYAGSGPLEAVRLGHHLVKGDTRTSRIERWIALIRDHQISILCCARGGLRSEYAAEWLGSEGVIVPRISGGYKSLRNLALTVLDGFAREKPFLVLSGRTGSGKSRILRRPAIAARSIDLEFIARHAGSSFGGMHGPQPPQASFENELAFAAFRRRSEPDQLTIVEDEARKIGALMVPKAWYDAFTSAPRVVLEIDRETRIQNIIDDYVELQLRKHSKSDDPIGAVESFFLQGISKIASKLGSERTAECAGLLQRAIAQQRRSGDMAGHSGWIHFLLEAYYDPCYDFDLSRKTGPIVARGSRDEVAAVLTDMTMTRSQKDRKAICAADSHRSPF